MGRAVSVSRRLIEDALVGFAREAVAIPWILSHQTGDRPPRPYGTIHVADLRPLGTPAIEAGVSGVDILERAKEFALVEVSMQTFGNDALDHLAAVKTHARRPSTVIGSLQTVLLGTLTVGSVRSIPALISTEWERRAQLDLTFSVRFDDDRVIRSIASVAVTRAEPT